jgi:hypothetical protein
MDDPSAQSASLLGDIGLLYASLGIKRKQCTTLGWRVRKLRQMCNLCTAKAKFMLYWDNPEKAIPAYRQAIAKGYSRKEVWNDPENAKLQSFPEFVKLVKSGTSK